jgi:hypothetical protein
MFVKVRLPDAYQESPEPKLEIRQTWPMDAANELAAWMRKLLR